MAKSVNVILNCTNKLTPATDKAGRSLRQLNADTKTVQRSINNMTTNATKKFNNFKSGAMQATKAVGALAVVGMGVVAKNGLELASDLQEVQNVVDTTFGANSTINTFAKTTANQFGVSQLQAKKFSGTLGAMMKASGLGGVELQTMSKGLTGLSGDFASFYNVDPQQAFDDIKSAMAGGTETMLKYGLNMQVASMQEYAHTKGINKKWEAMSQAEKTQLRYNYIMEKSKDAQGDFAKTNQGFANQMRILKLNFDDISMSIMTNVLPSVNRFVIKLNDVRPEVDKMVNSMKPMIKEALDFGKSIIYIVKNVGGFIIKHREAFKFLGVLVGGLIIGVKVAKAYLVVMNLINLATKAQGVAFALSPFGMIVIAIVAVIAVGYLLIKNWDFIKTKFMGFVTAIGAALISFKSAFVGAFAGIGKAIGGVFIGIGNTIKGALFGWINMYIKMFNILIGGLQKIKFKIPKGIPVVGGMGVDMSGLPKIPELKTYAKGGLANKASIFGEAGTEMAIPMKPNDPQAQGLLQDANRKMGNGNNKPIINIKIDTFIGQESFADKVGDLIMNKLDMALANG